MELTETIEALNKQLIDLYGIDTASKNAIWRIAWAEDQREKRLTKFSELGIEFIHPVPVELPKYGWIKERYILEKYEIVPAQHVDELCGMKVAYNCKFVFENNREGYLPPNLQVAQLVINTLNFAQYGNKSGLARYAENPTEDRLKEIARLENELYGNETDITDNLAVGQGVVLPSKFFGEK